MTVVGSVVGRTTVMSQIADVVRSGRGGHARTLTIIGTTGTGRSTIIDAAASLAESDELVLRCAGHPDETELPYAGLHQLLRPIADRLDTAVRGALSLERTTPADRMTISAGVLETLTALAREQFTLLLVDDVEHLDAETRQVLAFCARRFEEDAVALLLTGSPGCETTAGRAVVLDPLDDESALAILRARFGKLHTTVAERIIAAAGGLPLALLDIAGALSADERSGASSLPDVLPAGPAIRRLHGPDLGRLDSRTVRALVIASLGPPEHELLCRSLERAGLAIADLGPAERLGLIRSSNSRWEFCPPTVRLAVLDRADAPTVRATHALLATHADGTRRAWHLHRAALNGDESIGADLATAALEAVGRNAPAEAAEYWLASTTHTSDPQRRYAATEQAVECLLEIGLTQRANRLIDELIATAPDPVSDAQWRTRKAIVDLWRSQSTDTNKHADLLTRVAELSTAPTNGVAEDAWMTIAVACDVWSLDRPDGFTDLLPARAIGIRPVFAVTDAVRGVPGAVSALAGDWIDDLPQPRSLSETSATILAGYTFLWLDRVDTCERLVERLESFDLPEQPTLHATSLQLAAVCALRRGDWHDADQKLTAALQIAADGDLAMAEMSNQIHQAQLAGWRGQYEIAARMLRRTEQVDATDAPWAAFASLLTQASIEVGHDRYEAAAALYARAEQVELNHAFAAPSLNCRFTDHVDTLVRLERLDEAREVIERFRDFTAVRPTPTGAGALALAQGWVDADLSAFAVARDHFRAAVDRFAEARCLLAWGEALRRRRQRAAATPPLSQAHDIFVSLDAMPWVARARAELEACGVRRASEPVDPALSILTPREYEIAEVVATGLSNAEAAQRLFVSARTIGYHLANTYRKLGIGGRDDLARYF